MVDVNFRSGDKDVNLIGSTHEEEDNPEFIIQGFFEYEEEQSIAGLEPEGKMTVSAPEGMLSCMVDILIGSNARNVEVYNGDCYLGLADRVDIDINSFEHRLQKSMEETQFSTLTFKFVSTRPKGEDLVVHLFEVITKPPVPIPPEPEPTAGSNSMGMLMMMMSAAKGNGQDIPASMINGGHINGAEGWNENVPMMAPPRVPPHVDRVNLPTSDVGTTSGQNSNGVPENFATQAPFHINMIMGELSTLLDAKLDPILKKLDKVEAKLIGLERKRRVSFVGWDEQQSKKETELVQVDSGAPAGLKEDILALKQAVRNSN